MSFVADRLNRISLRGGLGKLGITGPTGFQGADPIGPTGFIGEMGSPGPTCLCYLGDKDFIDVDVTGATGGEGLFYVGASGDFKNADLSAGSVALSKIDFSDIPTHTGTTGAIEALGVYKLYKLPDSEQIRITLWSQLQLALYYRADNVDGQGTPGDATTTTLVNLANIGTYDGTINNGTGISTNVTQDKPFRYGITFISDGDYNAGSPIPGDTYIDLNGFYMQGGVDLLTAGTFEFWLRPDGGDPSLTDPCQLYGEFNTTIGFIRHGIDLGFSNNNLFYQESRTSGNVFQVSDNNTFVTGEYQQIVVVKTIGKLEYYVNGSLIDSDTFGGDGYQQPAVSVSYIGSRWKFDRGLNGEISIIRLFNQALSADQIQLNYQNTLSNNF